MFGFGKRESGGNQPTVISRISEAFGWWGGSSSIAPALSNTTAMQNPAVMCAVRTIAEGVASMPINIIETKEVDGLSKRTIRKDHWASKLINKPNAYQTRFEFVEMMISNAVLGKGALALKTVVGGEVRELLPIPSGIWEMEILTNGSYNFRVRFTDGSSRVFAAKDCLFFRGLSLDGYSSISAIETARKAVGIANALEGQTLQTASNGGRPSGVLSIGDPEDGVALDEDTRAKIIALWKDRFSSNGEGGILISSGYSTDFKPIQQNAVDSQLIESRKYQVEEIARIFRVHPAYLMASGTITPEIQRAHVRNTLMPWVARFEQALAASLLQAEPNLLFDFDEHELLRGDHSALKDFFASVTGVGGSPAIMSVNECRYELGLDPIADEWARTPLKGGYENSAIQKEESSK